MREDPDVILVGEMRDLETIQLAISAAETGHLVFGTLHTSSAAQTVDRMVDVFPPEQQTQIRVQLSGSLVAVFSQTLCRRSNPAPGQFGRVMAQEILINTAATANLIREGKTAQLYSQIQTGGELGTADPGESSGGSGRPVVRSAPKRHASRLENLQSWNG